jgi:uncharacterized protein (TIGR03435 family)
MRYIPAAASTFFIAASVSLAQSRTPRPAFDSFEVATIKPTPPDWTGGRYIRMLSTQQFVARGHGLNTLIAAAYNLSPQLISGGPRWIVDDHYDVLAKTPGDIRPNLEEQMAMLRNLLAARFNLAFHRERKEFSIYALTIAKNGPKLKDSTVSPDAAPEGPPLLAFVLSPQLVRLPGRYVSMPELASVMQRAALDRPVVDKTGLSGRYDFDLEFTPDEAVFGGMLPRPATLDASSKPEFFAAIQEQLGLKLEATRGSVEALVIDRVERPSAN